MMYITLKRALNDRSHVAEEILFNLYENVKGGETWNTFPALFPYM